MEFPIKKSELQEFRKHQLQRIQSEKRFQDVIAYICKEVERIASYTPMHQYNYVVDHRYYGVNVPFYGLRPHPVEREDLFPRILARLEELFPDSTIELAVDKSYIRIDWTS